MAFAQLTYRESLRDIEACLRAQAPSSITWASAARIARNTLADANATRDWRIYAELGPALIARRAACMPTSRLACDLSETVYALDATTIDLCLSVFPWAPFRSTKAAIKLHTLLDLRGNIPSFIHITDGKHPRRQRTRPAAARAGRILRDGPRLLDFERLYRLHEAGSFFVTARQVEPAMPSAATRIPSIAAPARSAIRPSCSRASTRAKIIPYRCAASDYRDPKTGKRLIFLTNNFDLAALTIAELYRCRWQVELFFKWIKQHLRIKAFFGTSENAVKTQIWIAVSVYVLVAIVKKRLKLPLSLYEMLQILSLTLFEKHRSISYLPRRRPTWIRPTRQPDESVRLTLGHY